MKQTCGSMREWLGVYADKELDPARAAQVRVHLETCADCRRELAQIQELHRLAKSVEHPRLAEDYWDWQRTRVWHGIRNAPRRRMPAFRPSFAWFRFATVAAGAAVVLVVVIAGWKAFMPGTGPVGLSVSERKATEAVARTPAGPASAVTSAPKDKQAEPAADMARARAEDRSEELAGVRPAAREEAGKSDVGYAGKGAGTAGTASGSGSARTLVSRPAPEAEVAAGGVAGEKPAAPAATGLRAGVSSHKAGRIVSGPVLLESPPLADADALDTGTVLLNVSTDSAGRVLGAAVRRSSGSARLDSVAVRQMRKSRFRAAVKNSRNVASSFEYPFRFQKKQVKPVEQNKQADSEDESDKKEVQPQKKDDEKQSDNGQSDQKDSDRQQDKPLKEKTRK